MRRGHRQRVTGIGSAQSAWGWRIHHLGATDNARQRETAGEAFRHRHQIRFHLIVLHSEQLAGAGETGLHFIGDQQNAVGIAQVAQRLHKIGRRDVKAAFPLDRLENDGRYLVRRNIRFENALQAFQRIRGGHAMRRIGVDTVIHRARERPEADFIGRDLTGEGHGHKGTAVEAAAEGNQPRTTGVSAGDFHRVLDRFRAGGEESRFCRPVNWRQIVDTLRQRNIAFVRHNLIGGVGERLQLVGNRGDHFRMAVTGI